MSEKKKRLSLLRVLCCRIMLWPILTFSLFSSMQLHAQKDTLDVFRDFIKISNGYKQMPIYLDIEMKNSTNYITGENDTATVPGQFFLRNEYSYVRFGEFEQVVNDSVALLVSEDLKQMILFTDASKVVEMIRKMMGAAVPDSSVKNLADWYAASSKNISRTESQIQLQGRTTLRNTQLPKQEIEMVYDTKEKRPLRVTTLSRSLRRIDSLEYNSLLKDPSYAANLLVIERTYFIIKDQFTTFLYKRIEQPYKGTVPVQVKDRIVKNKEGEYEPVVNYASYRLVRND